MATAILAERNPSAQSHSSFVAGGSLLKMCDAARLAGISVELLRYYANCGTVETERTVGGHRLVKRDSLIRALGLDIDTTEDGNAATAEKLTVVYARVSTDKQRKEGNLIRQTERLERFAAENYPGQPTQTISETGSGLNHERKGFVRLIDLILDGRVKRALRIRGPYQPQLSQPGLQAVRKNGS
ncbi:MAG TPA: recombinase family protein [Planctomycetaceae bacterium]|nr:recombinase family protein [Planctomycetaceae bacterium]